MLVRRRSLRERMRARTEFAVKGDCFESLAVHRAWVAAWAAGTAALLAKGVLLDAQCAAGAVAASALAAYVLADLGTAFYHWGVDNYGSGKTPVVGSQIAGFQGHHRQPWVITLRDFENRVHGICKAVVPCLAALLLCGEPDAAFDTFWAVFGACVVLSQQFHSWAHSKVADIPAPVRALQKAGLLVGRKAHGMHHSAPFENNYAIVSGLWNPLLDNSGIFPWLERAVHRRTGVEPRCWDEYGVGYVEDEPAEELATAAAVSR